ncbi:MAG: SAM-dependent DNA methyltransferase [Bacteroidales bacterium]|nr:SAM-dependent DNA methyltransferase [Bacteroidales bacterium]
MLTTELRNRVDKVWTAFWTGGISNPLTVIEQITYLLFIKRLDELETREELKANMLGAPAERRYFSNEQQDLRWSKFRNFDPEKMYRTFIREGGVFDLMKSLANVNGSSYSKYLKGATFMVPTPSLLDKVVNMISEIPMDDLDTKGDLYEYLLSKIATAGQNGQFRTPRHIIKMMVELMEPKEDDIVCDPAAGTCGFLVAVSEYFREHKPELIHKKSFRDHYNKTMFNGNEFDATMIRIGAMNMLLHGIENPNLDDKDSLSESNAGMTEKFTLVLANPPFKGSLDYESVESGLLKSVKTKKTELLFLALMLRSLKVGGRCAVIVPDGVLFGSSNAHKAIRKELIDNNQLEGVISMPAGVFRPYAGVSTAVLIFTKTGKGGTSDIWFYDMEADGYSLDDKRQKIDADDIPDIIAKWRSRENEKERKRTEKSFFVAVDEIRDNGFDLSVNKYKEIIYEEVNYESPKTILAQIDKIEAEKSDLLKNLKTLLG